MFAAVPFSFAGFSFAGLSFEYFTSKHNGEVFNFELTINQEPSFTFVIDTSLESTLNIDLSNESVI
jgi:hypothetical protein